MRRFLPLFTLLLIMATTSFAKNVTTKVDAVTVYRQNARIGQSGYIDIPVGTTEIVIDNLSAAIILPSVQVELSGSAIILSVTSRINYTKPILDQKPVLRMNDTIAGLNDKLEWIENQRQVYAGEEGLINEKQKMVGTITGLTVAELLKLSDLYRTRLMEIREKLFALKGQTKTLNDKRAEVQTRLNDYNNPTFKPTGEIVLLVTAKVATRSKVSCNYLVNQAGWNPIYDLRSSGFEKPLTLNTYGQVYQNTGLDWKDVKLTVSTGNPSQNNSRPILVPLYVDFYAPLSRNYVSDNLTNSALYKESNSVDDVQELKYNVEVVETQLTVEYDIEMAQTIPSDGKTYQVPLKDYEIPATYVHHTVPSMDKGAFLLAKVPNWGQYNILSGMMNLFFDGRYIGQSNINTQVTADTLLLSLGRDEKITVQRTPIVDKESHSFLGGNRKEKRTYEISVRNNKSKAITLEILDHIPVSKQQDIKVVMLDEGGAVYTASIGKLLWTLDLKPGETKKVRFSFEVSFPKDKPVSGF